MGRAGLAVIVGAIMMSAVAAVPIEVMAQGAPPAPAAPKRPPANVPTGSIPAANPSGAAANARPSAPMQLESARPIPVRPAESAPYDGSQRAMVDRISAYLSSVQTLIGDFVQVGPDGSRTVGKFYLQKPGRIRFEYEPPSPLDIVADGSSIAVRDRRLATQDLYPLSQTPLRFLLADQIDLVRDTNLVGVSRDANFISVTIDERQILIGTHRLVLTFNAKDLTLRQWTVTDPQGYETTVAIYNLDTIHKPDPNLFRISSGGWFQ